ncbi:MAG: hypothetical protein Tsb0034_08420 [Ekhidna sp.]
MDVLSDVLSKVKLKSVFYFNHLFAKPWGMDVGSGSNAQFHIVVEGSCTVKYDGGCKRLDSGGIVLFPKGSPHIVSDGSTDRLRDGREVVAEIINGTCPNQKGETRLVCGHFEFDQNFNHPLIQHLPSIIILNEVTSFQLNSLKSILHLIHLETQDKKQGSDAIVAKLGEVLFVNAIREYAVSRRSNFVHGIMDSRLANVLKEIHEAPHFDWKVNSLSKIAGMSRTGFLQKFKTLIGDTPYNYIKGWRMIIAKELLENSNYSIQEVAEKVGYESSASFVRVFKEYTETTPNQFRKAHAGKTALS